MALIDCSDGTGFEFGILIQKKDIFISKNGWLPSGIEVSQILKKYTDRDILRFYGEKAYHTFAAALSPDAAVPVGFKRIPYRDLFVTESDDHVAIVARAALLLDWLNHTKYCSSCGSCLYLSITETALECPQCRRIFYPVLAPCIIVLISKGEQILLARHVQHISDIYTCIAGFIEAGETAEEAVAREIREEVGLTVKDIRYRGSQSWPSPNQLMLAFRAEYVSGDITVQKEELSEAAWFTRNALPPIPLPGSAAYRLICGDWF